ncbi:hypothetical protein RND71_012702 [Anisodus tanguticus]|uniref:RNase H type-1 domain-containing protein n=1 Tax=Anisodus tanguticus TaxID=243964 RepID=A0AAE1SF53_9SOLA|nr:hypothetical protein RND71_012702 [Anisodus tanguticus]
MTNLSMSLLRWLIRSLENPVVAHSYREQNKVADILAKEGANGCFFDITQILIIPTCMLMKQSGQTFEELLS